MSKVLGSWLRFHYYGSIVSNSSSNDLVVCISCEVLRQYVSEYGPDLISTIKSVFFQRSKTLPSCLLCSDSSSSAILIVV